MLNSGGRNAHDSSALANAAECFDHRSRGKSVHAQHDTTFAQSPQGLCATFALAYAGESAHLAAMRSTSDILAALKDKGVTHERIGVVLGITTPNATKLYNPASKTGKPRKLSYDEGLKLIEEFGLSEAPANLEPLSEPVARLVVLHVANVLGASPSADVLDELAQDVAAFSEFVADPHARQSAEQVTGFLRALRSPRRAAR